MVNSELRYNSSNLNSFHFFLSYHVQQMYHAVHKGKKKKKLLKILFTLIYNFQLYRAIPKLS